MAKTYNDYPKAAQRNAQIALDWAEKNGWGSCGTPVGKKRANQLAKGEPISRDTIARMAAFERHRQNSNKELGDGCGRLMWQAWGGDEGVEWAQRKLEQIDKEKLESINTIRNKNFKEDKWIVDFFTKKKIGMSIKDMGLELKDFYNPKYQLPIREEELDLFAESDYITVYKYVTDQYGSRGWGPKSRPFCVALMKEADKVWTMPDIVELNNAPGKANRAGGGGYSVFKYRGGNNCVHRWFRYIYDPVERKLIEPDFIQPKQIPL